MSEQRSPATAGQTHVIVNAVLCFLAMGLHLLLLLSSLVNALFYTTTIPDLSAASDYERGRVVGYYTSFVWVSLASLIGLIWAGRP
jgi:hypothetical protein